MTAEPVHQPGPVPQSPAGIRAALTTADQKLFEEEYSAALETARVTYSLEQLKDVIERWWRFANLAAGSHNALQLAEQIRGGADVPVIPVDFVALRG